MQKILWQPDADFINNSNLKKYENWLEAEKGFVFADYQELWQWSVDQLEDFWESLWQYFDIQYDGHYEQVLNNRKMPGAKWFEGTSLNYAEHIFRKKEERRPALIFQNEQRRNTIPWSTLQRQVQAMQQFLQAQGVKQGDCVAACLPNIPETISCFLAVNSLGAVWTCCSPDFGESTVVERFAQVAPKVLIAVDGYRYGGKAFDRTSSVANIRQAIDSIEATVFIPYLDAGATLSDVHYWRDIQNAIDPTQALTFERVPFSHPIWVLYSSGTTGKPKAITHSHGGVLLEHLKYHAFHNDTKAGEHFFWFTTTGWMMWNFLQASMLTGAIPVLYDGSPAYPDMEVLWQMAEDLPIHHFGTSAPFLTACKNLGTPLNERYDFSQLRSIGSTGAPLPPEVFGWIYQNISENVWLCSISGGTDVCTAFVGGNPYMPVYKGYIQSRSLGCAIAAYDENGQPVMGSLGEMVIEQPMPSMPVFFWNDKDGTRYHSSYFEVYPGIWRHGDWTNIQQNGSLIIQGRSDATLNRNGIRIGTAEIYGVLDKMSGIKDSLILNLEQPDGGDKMPLFVVLAEGVKLDADLKTKIRNELRTQCSPRHIPTDILAVPDVPYTLSGKKMEVPVKQVLMKQKDEKSINREAIRNPAAMNYFLQLARR